MTSSYSLSRRRRDLRRITQGEGGQHNVIDEVDDRLFLQPALS